MDKNKVVAFISILVAVLGGGYLLFTMLPVLIAGTVGVTYLIVLFALVVAAILLVVKGIKKLLN